MSLYQQGLTAPTPLMVALGGNARDRIGNAVAGASLLGWGARGLSNNIRASRARRVVGADVVHTVAARSNNYVDQYLAIKKQFEKIQGWTVIDGKTIPLTTLDQVYRI